MKDDFFDQMNMDTFWALLNSNPEIKKRIDDFNQERYPHIIRKFIEKGRKGGYIHKEISLEAAMIYLTMYQEVLQRPEIQKTSELFPVLLSARLTLIPPAFLLELYYKSIDPVSVNRQGGDYGTLLLYNLLEIYRLLFPRF